MAKRNGRRETALRASFNNKNEKKEFETKKIIYWCFVCVCARERARESERERERERESLIIMA